MTAFRGRAGLTRHRATLVNLLAQGLGYKQIAVRLGVSPHTVSEIVESMRRQCGALNNTHLVVKVLRGEVAIASFSTDLTSGTNAGQGVERVGRE